MDSGEFSLIQVYMGHLNDFLNYSVYTVRRLRKEWDILSAQWENGKICDYLEMADPDGERNVCNSFRDVLRIISIE